MITAMLITCTLWIIGLLCNLVAGIVCMMREIDFPRVLLIIQVVISLIIFFEFIIFIIKDSERD